MTPIKSAQIFAVLIACASGFGVFAFTKYHAQEEKLQKEQELKLTKVLEAAEGYLQHSHPLAALQTLNKHKQILQSSPLADQWKKLALESSAALQDDKMLFELWSADPSLFTENEELNLQLGSYLLANQDLDNYSKISENWLYRGKSPEWVLLEADAYAIKGQPEKAIEILEIAPLQGEPETMRLVRLALLNGKEHPKIAWNYLAEAVKRDPKLADLNLYRAKLLEGSGRSDLAALEYKQAVSKNSYDPFFQEELVDFYLNQRNFADAFETLQMAVKSPANDKFWLRTVFLSKVFKPSKLNLADESLPSGSTTPFVRYLLAIPPTEFWNESLLSSQASVKQMSAEIPEAQWLKVFEDLKLGSDVLALETLNNAPEMAALNPSLYHGLKKAIILHHPHLKTGGSAEQLPVENAHPIFGILFSEKIPKEHIGFMTSNEIYPALALAAGWYEAALNLQGWTPNKPASFASLSSESPRWVAYGYAKALVANRSNEEALAFINMQSPSPQLSLLAGELNLKLGQYPEAEKALRPFAKNTSPIGVKSALLLSQIYSSKGQFPLAKQVIQDNAELANSIAGKEALARLELNYGDPEEAERLYSALSAKSVEAKSFFAKKAFQAGDYKTAYKLTKVLAEQFPERADLKAQLNQITKAAQKS